MRVIGFDTALGRVSMTGEYFAGLVSAAAQSGFGVAGMAARGAGESLRSLFVRGGEGRGVRVSEEDGRLAIDLHINVTYGLNIAEAVKSITHKVRYVVEEATGLSVARINVAVDDVI